MNRDKKNRFRGTAGMRPVSESTRISVTARLEEFRDGTEPEMTFEADLSNHDRAVVHELLCWKMGFVSRSCGRAAAGDTPAGPQPTLSSSLPCQITARRQQLLIMAYREEITRAMEHHQVVLIVGETGCGKTTQVPQVIHSPSALPIPRPPFSPPPIHFLFLAFPPRQITQKRQSLPIMAYREEITRAIEQHQVVLIVGETGCGKTTQVPQFILDHEWGKGRRCRVLCTQPRRISATSVAERIAAERGEKIGHTVGYQIRLESKGNRSSSLWMCTNGVLLRRLVGLGAHLHSKEGGRGAQGGGGGGGVGSGEGGGGSIVEPGVREAIAAAVKGMAEGVAGEGDGEGEGEGGGDGEGEEKGGVGREVDADVLAKLDATHIIVDEVHERDKFEDFMLIILRDLLRLHPTLKLVNARVPHSPCKNLVLSPRALLMLTSRSPHALLMLTSRSPHAHLTLSSCSPHALLMLTSCSPPAHLILTSLFNMFEHSRTAFLLFEASVPPILFIL
ncbi:unnamed protein product [Closterium sp. Naga37s-1]|nr:unnamed protein product [Closterium sp. Naga37s-1]